MACVFSIPMLFVPYFPRVPGVAKVILWGVPFGLCINAAKALQTKVRFRSFLLTLLCHSVVMVLAILSAFTSAFLVLIAWNESLPPWNPQVTEFLGKIYAAPSMHYSFAGCFFGVMIVSGIFQISRKMGPGVLGNWMLGKYHEPKEEERIFMFLDMKDSTTLAEKLGALRFSALVRDFFSDLTKPVLDTRAEVSHYIGDEAVLTWKVAPGLEEANCLRLFFEFRSRLASRAGHYRAKYGLVPEFKAGAHIGPVVATEVGDVKSEIVFHGDVLNTSARIQGMCSVLGEEFLISGELASRLGTIGDFVKVDHGRHLLKGKEHDVDIFGIRGPGDPVAPELPVPQEPVSV